jgi:pimeloyl-ACP methyl ester carboxylesterase
MDQRGVMEKVTSRDGTPIAFWRSGSGPPLVGIHGGVGDHTRWGPVLPALEQHFTFYAVDRRGRGGSGDASDYSLEREFEDVAAVVDSIGDQVGLVGHSFGGLCALEAALRTSRIHRLVLDEPTLEAPPGFTDEMHLRMRDLIDAGDRERALVLFLEEGAEIPSRDIELMRSLPSWPARVVAVHTALREERAFKGYKMDFARLKDLAVPTLLVVGGSTTRGYRSSIDHLAANLSDGRVAVIPGQGHVAMLSAPEVWAREVVAFLTDGTAV